MTWILNEVLLFLIIAFVLGVIAGWLAWRWRRQSVSAKAWNSLTAATESARSELELLEQQHQRLRGERQTLSNRVSTITSELDESRSELAHTQELKSKHEAQRDALAAERAQLRIELQRNSERLTSAEENLRSARATVAELVVFEAESKQLKSELEIRAERLVELERSLIHSDSIAEQLAKQLASVEANLDTVRTELNRQRREYQSVGKALQTSRRLVARLEPEAAKVPGLTAELGSTRQGFDKSENRVAELAALLATSRFERDAANNQVFDLGGQLHDAGERIAELSLLETKVGRLIDALNATNATNAELEARLVEAARVRRELEASRSALRDLDAALTDRIAQNEALAANLDAAQRQVTTLNQKVADRNLLRSGLDDALVEIDQLEAELLRRSEEAHRVRTDVNTAHRRLAELELELAHTNSVLLARTNPQAAEEKAADLAMAREHIAKLEAELETTESTLLDLAASRRRIAELEAQVRTATTGSGGTSSAPVPERMPEPTIRAAFGATQHPDDLTVIRGIGARIESLLNDQGITSWDDLAHLHEVDQTELESHIDVPAPIDPESWIVQAKLLVARYPERTGRPNKREYRRTTDKKDRIRVRR